MATGQQRYGEDKTRRQPQNTRLWAMVVGEAKRKYRVYPSIAASRWVHQEYKRRGGRFVESTKQDDRHTRGGDLKPSERKKRKKKPPPRRGER